MSIIQNNIKERRSRFPGMYEDRPIEKDDILKVLSSANYAPTHRKTEPWRFKVLQGSAIQALGEFLVQEYIAAEESPSEFKTNKIRKKAVKTQTMILICMWRDPEERVPEWEEVSATAMAVQNMWLTCTELGIGCYWSSPKAIHNMHKHINLSEGETCLGLFYMGYSSVDLPPYERGSIDDKVEWIS